MTAPLQSAKMKPCCLALSSSILLGTAEAAHKITRRWRALSLDTQTELVAGELETNCDDPLAVVRDKAAAAVRSHGLEPQRFILENVTAGVDPAI